MENKCKKKKWKFDGYEIGVIINALVEWRNKLIAEGRTTDAIDELLLRLCK